MRPYERMNMSTTVRHDYTDEFNNPASVLVTKDVKGVTITAIGKDREEGATFSVLEARTIYFALGLLEPAYRNKPCSF